MFWFKKEEKLALDSAVRAAGRLATELLVDRAPDGHVFPATASHFRGNPYFEAGDSWPTYDGHPYDFICQVNLKDCPERPNVPFDLFTVFLCWTLVADVDFERTCVVRTYQNVSPARWVPIARPAPFSADDYRVCPCTVRTRTFMTYPSWSMKRFPAIAAAAARFRNPDAAFHASLRRLGYRHEFRSRVGGFPTWVHESTFEYDDMVFLAQIDYEPPAKNCIGDAAPIYIAVSATDPTKIDTDVWQSF